MDCPNCGSAEEQIEITLNPVTGRTEYHCYVCGMWWVAPSDENPNGND
ncbi:MAG: hypothetical protein WC401_11415 [Bacteroidales bacterium]